MSIEALILNYRDGESIGFAFDVIREILSTDETKWESEYGCLNVQFKKPFEYVDIYLGKDAPHTNQVDGIMISRPIVHPDYLARVFRVLELGDAMLSYSDETTPVFVRGANPAHYPADLLERATTSNPLGRPACQSTTTHVGCTAPSHTKKTSGS